MKKLDILYALILVFLSAYFRFTNLAQNPGIYNDEGTLLNISINLHKGSFEYLGIQGSWLLAGRMPFFPWLLSLTYYFFEPNLLVLRAFTATSGVLSVLLLFLFFRSMTDKNLLFLKYTAPLVLALHPQFVLYNRIGFGYNLLTPLTILIIWFLWSYLESKNTYWLILASIFGGIGILIELAYIAFVVLLIVLIILFDPKRVFFVVIISLIPLFLYFLISLSLFGAPFLYDWQTTFERGTSYSFVFQLLNAVFISIITFSFVDLSLLIGIIGTLLLKDRRLGIIGFLGIIVPVFVINRTFTITNQSFYYYLPFIPFVTIGISSVVENVVRGIFIFSDELNQTQFFQETRKKININFKPLFFALIIQITFVIPAILLIFDLDTQVKHKFRTSFDYLLIDINEFSQTLDFLNKTSKPKDTIIASPAIAWAFQANTTDYQISIAVNEKPTIHFPNGIPRDRMRFDSNIESVDYVIIDSIMRSWSNFDIPGIEDLIIQIETNWTPVFKTDTITVYHNSHLLQK